MSVQHPQRYRSRVTGPSSWFLCAAFRARASPDVQHAGSLVAHSEIGVGSNHRPPRSPSPPYPRHRQTPCPPIQL